MRGPALLILTFGISMVAVLAQAQNERPVRTFPEFDFGHA
jgi:hypothetical protein